MSAIINCVMWCLKLMIEIKTIEGGPERNTPLGVPTFKKLIQITTNCKTGINAKTIED